MNSIVVLWSVLSGACLMFAGLHLLVWLRNRHAWENLLFSLSVAGVVGLASGELDIMLAPTPDAYAAAMRWSHLCYGFAITACLGFVHLHFGGGSAKLLGLAISLRALAVLANYTTGVSLHVGEIISLRQVGFFGETVSILAEWTPNPWVLLGQLATVAQIVYVGHASRKLWRNGERNGKNRALLVGGGLMFFFAASAVQAGLVAAGVLRMPFLVSFTFLGVVLVMGYELSRDVLRAAELLRDLQRSELESALHRRELAHLSRVSVLGELAGTLAHELNQPLAAILGNAQVGRRMVGDESPDLREVAAILDDVADDAKRAGGIIHGMRAMFRKDSATEPQSVDLNEAVDQVLNLLHSEIVSRKARIDFQPGAELPLAAAGRVEVQQIILNLVINGLDAMKGATREALLEIATRQEAGQLQLVVRDHGTGIPAELMPRLFEPFVTTKPGGLGLGLPICRGIAERFRGDLKAENHPSGGAVFRLTLPAAP